MGGKGPQNRFSHLVPAKCTLIYLFQSTLLDPSLTPSSPLPVTPKCQCFPLFLYLYIYHHIRTVNHKDKYDRMDSRIHPTSSSYFHSAWPLGHGRVMLLVCVFVIVCLFVPPPQIEHGPQGLGSHPLLWTRVSKRCRRAVLQKCMILHIFLHLLGIFSKKCDLYFR